MNEESTASPSGRTVAFGCFKEAAKLGSVPAYTLLGAAYYFGVGTVTNSTKAISTLQSAAARNEPHATLLLAYMHSTGTIANYDAKLGEELARKGAAMGVATCNNLLEALGHRPEPMAKDASATNYFATWLIPKSLRLDIGYVVALHRELATKQDANKAAQRTELEGVARAEVKEQQNIRIPTELDLQQQMQLAAKRFNAQQSMFGPQIFLQAQQAAEQEAALKRQQVEASVWSDMNRLRHQQNRIRATSQ